MNIHSSTDDFQIWGYVAFVGILETVYNPFLLGETKLNKKTFNGCLFYRSKSIWHAFTSRAKCHCYFCCDNF